MEMLGCKVNEAQTVPRELMVDQAKKEELERGESLDSQAHVEVLELKGIRAVMGSWGSLGPVVLAEKRDPEGAVVVEVYPVILDQRDLKDSPVFLERLVYKGQRDMMDYTGWMEFLEKREIRVLLAMSGNLESKECREPVDNQENLGQMEVEDQRVFQVRMVDLAEQAIRGQ